MRSCLLALLLSLLAWPLWAELSQGVIRDALEQELDQGQIIDLQSPAGGFYAIYTETVRPEHQGVLVMLHGEGGNPDQKPLIHGLRQQLAGRGWASLSLQLPPVNILDDWAQVEQQLPVAVQRVTAAMDFLAAREALKGRPVVLLGQGYGAVAACQWLGADNSSRVAGMVSIGWPMDEDTGDSRDARLLQAARLPLLDVYSGSDRAAFRQAAAQRRLLLRDRPQYRQIAFARSPLRNRVAAEMLETQLVAWIKQLPPGGPAR